MDVQGHELRTNDVPVCAKLLEDRYPHEGFTQDSVLRVFPSWISDGILKGWVVEHAPQGLICFGASVFVTDRLAKHLSSEAARHVGAELLRTALSPYSPVCPPGVGRGSKATQSVNIVIFHSGLPPAECDADTATRVKSSMMQGFLRLHNGYEVSRIFVEAFNERERAFYGELD